MKFNLWFVLLLALMPVFILFTGLTAAGGFESATALEIIGILVAAAVAIGYLATRHADDDEAGARDEKTEEKTASVEVLAPTPEVRSRTDG